MTSRVRRHEPVDRAYNVTYWYRNHARPSIGRAMNSASDMHGDSKEAADELFDSGGTLARLKTFGKAVPPKFIRGDGSGPIYDRAVLRSGYHRKY